MLLSANNRFAHSQPPTPPLPHHPHIYRQLWTNYKRQSGESLSILFLYIWLIGDFFCLVGLILMHLALHQILLAGYYAIVDALLIIQSTSISRWTGEGGAARG